MFKKPFKVKSNTQMKGCDKKKLKLELMRNFPILSAEDLKEILPTKDDFSLVKVLTHSNDSVLFYCVEKQPIIFSRGNKLYPTVYLLWKYPHILPYFTAAAEVIRVLQGGADFMSAGIISPSDINRYGKLNKSDSVYINVINNKAAMAVGETALSSQDMYMAAGRGKCVIVLHTYEDELCKFSTGISLPKLGPVFGNVQVSDTESEEEEEPEKLSYAKTVKTNDECSNNLPIADLQVNDNNDTDVTQHELASEDDVLMYCFIKALNVSLKNVKLPLLISNFYKVHMIPCCPEGKTIDIKKTKYKKMSKFMQEMASDNLVQIEEPSPGVQSITQVNYSHYLVSGFVDHYPSNGAEAEEKTEAAKVCEKYSVTAITLPLFSEFLIKKGESMTVSEARKYTAEYIRKFKLPLPDAPSMVKLDDVLRNIFTHGSSEEVPDVVKWEVVMNKVVQKMSRSFKVINNKAIFAQKEQKGKLPLIDIRVAQKAGHKKVTLVNNLEAYGINIDEFSRECQRGVAASATINQINGLRSSQLQIQGNQVIFLEKILTGKYNIPKKYLNGLQFAPKKK